MEYIAVIHKAEEGGYWAEVIGLPGCVSQGETVEETVANVSEAVSLYMEVRASRGEAGPKAEEVVFIATVMVPPVGAPVAKPARSTAKRRTAAA